LIKDEELKYLRDQKEENSKKIKSLQKDI